jgi:hypothetical protein
MTDNLNPDQFGEAPKKRWVPDQTGHSIPWHILKWHIKGRGPANAKGQSGPSKYDDEAWHKIHMQAHADGEFEVGHEHEHFTPKKRK